MDENKVGLETVIRNSLPQQGVLCRLNFEEKLGEMLEQEQIEIRRLRQLHPKVVQAKAKQRELKSIQPFRSLHYDHLKEYKLMQETFKDLQKNKTFRKQFLLVGTKVDPRNLFKNTTQ